MISKEEWFMKIKTAYKYLTFISVVGFLIFIAYCGFVAIIGLDVITYKEIYQPVLNKDHKVKVGELLQIDIDLCKNFPFPREKSETELIDSTVIELVVPEVPPADVGCRVSHYTLKVTKDFPVGEPLRLKRENFYKVSPFTIVNEVWISEYFEVIP